MGNYAKSSRHTFIEIYTDHVAYNAGETMKGLVLVTVAENIVAESLHLRLLGKEHCEWEEGGSLNQHRYSAGNVFFKMDHPLANFEKSYLKQGVYAWPFQLDLPDELPGSFESVDYQETYIRYEICAFLVLYQDPESLLQFSKPLQLIERFRKQIQPQQACIRQRALKCCFWEDGDVGLYAYIESTHMDNSENVCYLGESLHVEVRVDNTQYSKQIQYVTVELVQNTYMKKGHQFRNFEKVLQIMKSDEGLGAGTRKNFLMEFTIDMNRVPGGTSVGTFVARYYTLRFGAKFKTMLARNEPKVSIKVFLLDQRTAYSDSHEPPFNVPEGTLIHNIQEIHHPIVSPNFNSYLSSMNSLQWPSHLFE